MKCVSQALFALVGAVCCVVLHTGAAHAASERDLEQAVDDLKRVLPEARISYELKRTWGRAIITNRVDGALLTIDPEFLSGLTPDGVLFVVAHEYAHVHLNHLQRLGEKAMQMAGMPTAEMAFDALEKKPMNMEPLHALNRQFELDADEVATKWLKELGVNACSDDVLASIDNQGMMLQLVPSHPGFYARRQNICRR